MVTIRKILFVLVFIVFIKCEKDSVERIEVSDKVGVILKEDFTDINKKEFLIRFVPLQNCHCMNQGSLNMNYVRFDNSYDFHIKNIQIPSDCNDRYGCPYSEINLGNLQNGVFDIQIRVNNKNNSGELRVTDNAYCLTLTEKNIDLRGSNFRRITDNSLWGAFCYNTESELNTGLSIIDSLKAYGAEPTSLEDGDYLFFSIVNGKAIKSLENIVPRLYYGKDVAFVFDYNFEDEKLTSLLEKYKSPSGDFYIMVRTGKGFSFYNWR